MQVRDFYHLDKKYQEFFQMHLLAASMMIVIYVAFSYYKIEPYLIEAFNFLIPFNLLMAFAFYKKLFKEYVIPVFFFSVVVESLMWFIYPRMAQYTPISSMCYIGAIIILSFHLQHTKIKYCIFHFLIISASSIYFFENKNLILITLLHVFITTINSIQSIIFRRNAAQITHQKELHKNILNLQSYFSHNLINPINNILAVISSGIDDQQKLAQSLEKNSNRIEKFLKDDFDDVNYLLNHQEDIFTIPIFNNFKRSSIIVILSVAIFYLLYTIDIYKPISSFSYVGLAIFINFMIFIFHLYKTTNYFSFQKISYIYLLIAQVLFTSKYLLSPNAPNSLPLLISSYLFTIALAANTRAKYIFILTGSACLFSIVLDNLILSIMVSSLMLYFTKVVFGFHNRQELISTRIKELVKEETTKKFSSEIENKILPVFNQLKSSINNYINCLDNKDNNTEIIKNAHMLSDIIHSQENISHNHQSF